MSFLKDIKNKAGGLAAKHGEKIDTAIDKAAELADKKLDEKHDGKIATATEKAKGAVDKLAGPKDET